MNITDVYSEVNNDHKVFLAQEAKKLGIVDKQELRELSGAMVVHGVRLVELLRAMRNYVQNPFGKYFYLGGVENGAGKKFG